MYAAAIFVYSIEFVVKASVPPYEVREALYIESVVREDKWTTEEVIGCTTIRTYVYTVYVHECVITKHSGSPILKKTVYIACSKKKMRKNRNTLYCIVSVLSSKWSTTAWRVIVIQTMTIWRKRSMTLCMGLVFVGKIHVHYYR